MTRTGYSCEHVRRKLKHGCRRDIEHWCNATGSVINPMTCHKSCERFKTLAELHKRPGPRIEAELL
jgi:hypothetical protein